MGSSVYIGTMGMMQMGGRGRREGGSDLGDRMYPYNTRMYFTCFFVEKYFNC